MKTVQTKELYGAKVGDTIKYRDPMRSAIMAISSLAETGEERPDDGHVIKVGLVLDVNTRKNAAKPVLCLMEGEARWLSRQRIRWLKDVELIK